MSSSSVEQVASRADRGRTEPMAPLMTMLAADVVAVHHEAAGDDDELALALGLGGSAGDLHTHTTRSEERAEHVALALLPDVPPAGDATLPVVDPRTFLRERLARLSAEDRAAVLELLEEVAVADPPTRDPRGLATSMALVREGLREPLSPCVVERDEPQGLDFDSIVALSAHAFYVRGWARDTQAELTRLTVVSPEGSRAELLPGAHRNPRPDVDSFYEEGAHVGTETGFVAYCETRAPSYASGGWVLEMENALGVAHEVAGPPVSRDLLAARNGILADLQGDSRPETTLMDHVVPAIGVIQERLDKRTEIEAVRQYGEPPRDPEASVVIPLYGRIDFLERQLAQFVHDPELRESDLIYVLDSPDLAPALEAAAGQLFELYGVPFRTAVLSQNGGYSVANNRGASLARGRLLLLLNSDVLPARPGWLSRLAGFYDADEKVGALGPKLLFEDDTLQHAGICFRRPPGGGAWENEHFFKGLHRSLPAANVTRPVPAVTGACLLTDRALYEKLGGLRGMYVQGDYEDTDFCLRLREAGYETWYLPEVELYHLEGQSYALETRQAMSRYNVWLHSRLWDAEIERATIDA
jgi:O-antigen biosynthesis protein